MIKFPVDRAIQYRQEVERVYVALILQLVHCGHTALDVSMLLYARLQSPLAVHLQQWQQILYLSPQTGTDIEYAVLHTLVTYFYKVKQLRDSYCVATGQGWLECERQALGLQPHSAHLINTLLLSPGSLTSQAYGLQSDQLQSCVTQNIGAVSASYLNQIYSSQVYSSQAFNSTCQCGCNVAIPTVAAPVSPIFVNSTFETTNYSQLEQQLKEQAWRQANEITLLLMMRAVGRQIGDHFSSSDVKAFPCDDLYKIDYLWLKFSGGQFGFSVQKKFWRQFRALDQFAIQVGWLKNNNWLSSDNFDFSLQAKPGHLPALPLITKDEVNCLAYMTALVERLEACPLPVQ